MALTSIITLNDFMAKAGRKHMCRILIYHEGHKCSKLIKQDTFATLLIRLISAGYPRNNLHVQVNRISIHTHTHIITLPSIIIHTHTTEHYHTHTLPNIITHTHYQHYHTHTTKHYHTHTTKHYHTHYQTLSHTHYQISSHTL